MANAHFEKSNRLSCRALGMMAKHAAYATCFQCFIGLNQRETCCSGTFSCIDLRL